MKRLIVAASIVILLALPVRATADWSVVIEAINTFLLRAINRVETLIRIEQEWIDRAQIGTYNRYRFFFANNAAFRAVQASIAQVQGIRREIEAVACGWQFSPRTTPLRDLFLHPTRLCRPTFRLIWGEPARTAGRDLDELQDYVATLTANELSARSEAETTWTRVYPEVFKWITRPGWSPGESNRVEAMMLAMTGQVAIANNQILDQKLLIDELELDRDRREERRVVRLQLFALNGLASLSDSPAGTSR
jgi:hypothetical protein